MDPAEESLLKSWLKTVVMAPEKLYRNTLNIEIKK